MSKPKPPGEVLPFLKAILFPCLLLFPATELVEVILIHLNSLPNFESSEAGWVLSTGRIRALNKWQLWLYSRLSPFFKEDVAFMPTVHMTKKIPSRGQKKVESPTLPVGKLLLF